MNGFDLSTISNCYYGQSACSAIYLGSTKIWPTGPHDYSQDYFTIVSTSDNNVIKYLAYTSNFTRPISISIDGGISWTNYSSSVAGTTLTTLNNGDKLLLRGFFVPSTGSTRYNYFASTGTFILEGNIMSLRQGSSFKNYTSLTENGIFYYLFRNCTYLTSAENLILPATTLSSNCYTSMFSGCTSLTTAPELPANTLATYCYSNMFNGCTSLKYIKCLATDISASNCTYHWVMGVSNTGNFYKASSMSSWTRDTSGIPYNWTIQNA